MSRWRRLVILRIAMDSKEVLQNPRVLRIFTGLTPEEFGHLVPAFVRAWANTPVATGWSKSAASSAQTAQETFSRGRGQPRAHIWEAARTERRALPGCFKTLAGREVGSFRRTHMCAMMLSPNSEHFSSFAPSIMRAKS